MTVAQVLVGIVKGNMLFRQSRHFVEETITIVEKCFKRIRKEKEKARAVDVSFNRHTERPPRKCFRCGSEDHMIAKCPKPPKYDEKRQTQVRCNEKGNLACDRG